MENGEIRSERKRGRKRKRVDVQNVEEDIDGKKRVKVMRSRRLVGCYVRKEFEGSGVFLGKIVSYDTGLYRVYYEDEDSEDLDSGEVREFLIDESEIEGEWLERKNKLDDLLLCKDKHVEVKDESKIKNVVPFESANVVADVKVDENSAVSDLVNASCDVEAEVDQIDDNANNDSVSDSCEEEETSSEMEVPVVAPPELPPSSGNIGVPTDYVSHLFSVYSFLRSFSVKLFLSPFALDDFVGSLNCSVPNTLLDSVHVALMRVLRHYFEKLSSDGLELASKCLRGMDWSLLDTLTWPIYLVHYLMVIGYTDDREWKGFYIHALEREYYTLSASKKLIILQILCDDVLDSEELRSEIDIREESEVGIDLDTGTLVAPVAGPRRVHPRNSKTSACKGQEAMEIIAQSHETKFSSSTGHLGLNVQGQDGISDVDQDGNGDECRLCGMDGTLLCCDGCPASYHSRCIGVSKMFIPEGAWYCPECTMNKVGLRITKGTTLKGAEIFGVDVYAQAFIGACDHLIVVNASTNSNSCARYYSKNDIPCVLKALLSSMEHIVMYEEICKAIIQYWEIPEDIILFTETPEPTKQLAKEDVKCTMRSSLMPLGALNCNVPETPQTEEITSCVAGGNSGNTNKATLNASVLPDHAVQQVNGEATVEIAGPRMNILVPGEVQVKHTVFLGSLGQGIVQSDFMGKENSGLEVATCMSTSIIGNSKEYVNGPCVTPKVSISTKDVKISVDNSFHNLENATLYMGSSFKIQGYVNNYLHGDFAASAAAKLAVLSSEENQVSGSSASDCRKLMSANVSLQVKAFSSVAMRFFWPHTEKRLIEVPRERCSWCFSCKAPVVSKRGCLLNAAVSNAIKGSMKILAGLRHAKSGEGCLPGIATYVMFIEESLSGLTVGPFLSSAFRRQWRTQAEHANTCGAIKKLLLELEENIRTIALSGDWVKLVDGWSAESSVTQSATSGSGSTQKRRPGRRGRKMSTVTEVTADDGRDMLADFTWWRGGKLTKLLFQKGILPRTLVKKSARQGGSRNIPGIYYVEESHTPRRSRQLVWRTAVEMSKNISQLALQVRYLDFLVRWNDLIRPEQSIQDVKGPETEASAFRNAYITDKRILDNDIRYCVAFGNQKHLPSRVMKNIIEVEQSQIGKENYWFSETRIPLYLIKEFEENAAKTLIQSADKPVDVSVNFHRRRLKAFRKDIFSYLIRKRDNMEKLSCAFCEKDVLLGDAVKCGVCQGLSHELCTISSAVHINEEVEYLITCKQCYHTKALTQTGSSNESPTSPLLLERREFTTVMVSKAEKLTDYDQSSMAVESLQHSSDSKSINPSKSGSKSKRKLLSWGLIWRKKNSDDTGIDFRLKNILLKGNRDMDLSGPLCHLCRQPYNSDLMYIRCETCSNWYHAEAVELEESKIFNLVGFKCCRCRRIKSPLCPYKDLDSKKQSEEKQNHTKARRQDEKDPNLEVVPQEVKVELATTALPETEQVVYVAEDDPLLFNHTRVEQFTEQDASVGYEWNPTSVSASGPKKLPVRRHNKREKEDHCLASNSSHGDLSIFGGNILNSADESLSHVEWDSTAIGLNNGMMLNYEDLTCEDMEFEPHTYFSYNELLASDDGGLQDVVGSSGNMAENWDNSSFSQREPRSLVEHAVDRVPCRMCSHSEPCPDLCCQVCGLCIHSHCSPWNEQSFRVDEWRCGKCREWL
ncbi:hypothetical protein ACH5RR_009758 [Cinchona calisaya]|uniref:Uncharacterized protein n=1 Tax=Cinchona calisaya TaxID=153742 RepID=A0ABD3AF64_9GENT